MRYKKGKYSKDETKFIKDNYVEKGCKYCAEKLNRKYISVQKKAQRLGIRSYQSKRWTQKEKDYLEENYEILGAVGCSTELEGRATTAIQKMAGKLGLSCDLVQQRRKLGLKVSNLPKDFYVSTQGYVLYLVDGNRDDKVLYHRYLMEQHLGTKLTFNEVVHHTDGDKLNNDLENLQLMTRKEHLQYHMAKGDIK